MFYINLISYFFAKQSIVRELTVCTLCGIVRKLYAITQKYFLVSFKPLRYKRLCSIGK